MDNKIGIYKKYINRSCKRLRLITGIREDNNLANPINTLSRFKKYLDNILDLGNNGPSSPSDNKSAESLIEKPNKQVKRRTAIRKFKLYKWMETDNIPIELNKACGEAELLTKYFPYVEY